MWFSPAEAAELTLNTGDVVVVEGGAGYGRSATLGSDLDGWGFQNSINRLRPRENNEGQFTDYCIGAALRSGYIGVTCGVATIPHLTAEKLGQMRIPNPPPHIQRSICQFLGRETARVDALIGKQEQLITALREDRTAIITHAVTKGLNRTVPMNFSGDDFVGNIPAHWEMTRLGWVTNAITDCAHSTPVASADGEYTVVRSGSIRDGRYRPEFSFQTDRTTYLERVERGVPSPGDVFFTREAPAGEACIVPDQMNLCLGQRMVLIKIRPERFLPQLVIHAIYASHTRAYFDVQMNGSTVGNLKMDRISKTPLPRPPLEEQHQILGFLDDRCRKIDELVGKANAVITRMREFRSALITDAVTGKIDVRGAA
jgi:type I restriction enzyme S subunit